MFIQTKTTADPDRLTFLPGQQVLPAGTLEFADRQAAVSSALAAKLFEVPGVSRLVLGPDYITVTKDAGDWRHLKPALLGAIMEYFMSGAPVLSETARTSSAAAGLQDPTGLASKVKDALRRVIDPELGYNIVDLGLIYDIRVLGRGAVSVTMTTTTPGCPATSYLTEGARDCVLSVEGAASAEIVLTHEPPWSPELMSGDAKAHLGIRSE